MSLTFGLLFGGRVTRVQFRPLAPLLDAGPTKTTKYNGL